MNEVKGKESVMSTYPECPHCGNSEKGAQIWNCGNCGCVHCRECDSDAGGCPECEGGGSMNLVGYVDPDSDDDDDDLGSGEFSDCPRCGKNDSGDSIWKCKSCGCIHCMDCDPDGGKCPECGGSTRKIGNIV